MFNIVDEHVFPFLRTLGGEGSAFSEHMKDARLGIPTPALLAKAVEKLDAVQMDDRDTKGDVYEYMLGKIASAGQNGQFRTPRHIIALMVELTEPKPPLLSPDSLGVTPREPLNEEAHSKNNLPDILRRWEARSDSERERSRTAQSFVVHKSEIAATDKRLARSQSRGHREN
jgi:type I restriction enzyme M protein